MPSQIDVKDFRRVLRAAALAVLLLALGLLTPAGAVAAHAAKVKKKGVTVKLKSGTITIAFSAAVWKDVNGGSSVVGSHAAVTAPATETAAGVLSFPIAKGSLNSVSGHGTVTATGGFTTENHLSLAGLFESSTSASATGPAIAIGTTSKLSITSPEFMPSTVPFLTLNLKHVKVVGNKHGVTISKIPAHVTAPGAQLMLSSAIKSGEQIATVTIQGKA